MDNYLSFETPVTPCRPLGVLQPCAHCTSSGMSCHLGITGIDDVLGAVQMKARGCLLSRATTTPDVRSFRHLLDGKFAGLSSDTKKSRIVLYSRCRESDTLAASIFSPVCLSCGRAVMQAQQTSCFLRRHRWPSVGAMFDPNEVRKTVRIQR